MKSRIYLTLNHPVIPFLTIIHVYGCVSDGKYLVFISNRCERQPRSSHVSAANCLNLLHRGEFRLGQKLSDRQYETMRKRKVSNLHPLCSFSYLIKVRDDLVEEA